MYLTNWKRPAYHGPGRRFTIMADPRRWEHGVGRVAPLIPALDWLAVVKAAVATKDERVIEDSWIRYVQRFDDRLRDVVLAPGVLTWAGGHNGDGQGVVEDGDTLCCACAVGARCHRQIAAPWLVRAGWSVVLDGKPLPRTVALDVRP